ncbi:hypothetical protein AXX16_1196 [Serratia rubidaea]|nr:hypothetical protein AXX16_1196 [Serratia rubidaea]
MDSIVNLDLTSRSILFCKVFLFLFDAAAPQKKRRRAGDGVTKRFVIRPQ